MGHPSQTFHWTWNLRAAPAALWPLVSDTDRFNRDCGYPAVRLVNGPAKRNGQGPTVRRLSARVMGLTIEWLEEAFEWAEPFRYRVQRKYSSGPVAAMNVACTLHPTDGGGTRIDYELEVTPSGLAGRLGLPWWMGRRARGVTARVFRSYDEAARRGARVSTLGPPPRLSPGGAERLAAFTHALSTNHGISATRAHRLAELVSTVDDLTASRLRAYAIADQWKTDRRETLQLFLHATRAGLLDFSWELVCPHCRGAQQARPSLESLSSAARCDSCDLDFTANFDQSVELSFSPNPAVRKVLRREYCVGGPQLTPHVVAQQKVPAGSSALLRLSLAPGRYRVRVPGRVDQHAFRAAEEGPASLRIDLGAKLLAEPVLGLTAELEVCSAVGEDCLAIVERLAWSDQATTAAEVTSLQLFRDLFSREVLRRGERFSIGAMTVVFTDLKNSTQLYREIGDAPAFGRVLTHFEILKTAVEAEGGAIVKTMGDAVMAVWTRPVAALRAVVRAQRWLAEPQNFPSLGEGDPDAKRLQPLRLKAGIHCGPCLAITQNERLDYFGSTVNFAARLCGLCTGSDVILSAAAREDAEVSAYLSDCDSALSPELQSTTVKGFGSTEFAVWRMTARTQSKRDA